MTGWTLAIGIFVTGGCLSLYLALRAVGSVLVDIDRRDGEGELLLTEDMIVKDCNQSVAVVSSESAKRGEA